ncbi:MAG TPA: TadE/TadG family type IV pilus assembly protein [Rhizomicrobium sp.]|jgi:Flp pilus assembly protein TadG|nr:TadE/TadG family type IV pilus assembly protein [Rhizomicrobium sp.]
MRTSISPASAASVKHWHDCRGSTAIEFALLSPIFLFFLLGIISYGGYFWLAHSVQELANDAARAAVAGLTSGERQTLAQSSFADEIAGNAMLKARAASLSYNGQAQTFTVRVSYDASAMPFWAAAGLVPMPPSTIVRTATVRLGGF